MRKIFTLLMLAASAVAGAQPSTSATTPSEDGATVISVFSDAYTDISGTNFNPNWGQATVYSAFDLSGDNMLKYATLNYQGIEFGSDINAAGKGTLHMDIWSEDNVDLDIFCISRGAGSVTEASVKKTLVANQWNTIDIDLSEYVAKGLAVSDLFQFKFDEVARTISPTIYIDNIYFYGTPAATEPIVAATNPFEPAANVLSIYSESYMDPAGINYNPSWGQSTVYSVFEIGEDSMIKYGNINYQGIEFGENLDASDMEYMHMDVWTPDVDSMDVYLINPGTPALERMVVAHLTKGAWTSINVPLSAFSDQGLSLDEIYQMKFDSKYTSGGTIFVDNMYFYKVPMPMMAAADPTHAAENVMSIYSESYMDPTNVNYYPNWSQSTKYRIHEIGEDSMIEYSVLNYQGIEFGETIDASSMDSLHIDVWSTSVTNLDLYLISIGSGEKPYRIALEANTWNSVDIPLSDYTGQGLSINDLHQIKFVDPDGKNGAVFIDNLYFFKEDAGSVSDVQVETFNFYPNPASSNIHIELAEANDYLERVDLININGEVVSSVKFDSNRNAATIPVYNIAKGAYFIKVTSDQGVMTKQIMIR